MAEDNRVRAKSLPQMSTVLDSYMPPVPNEPIGASSRLKLSDIIPEKDYWRIYIDRSHHYTALSVHEDDPGSIYDREQSPGFKASMLGAYSQVLDGNDYAKEFTTGLLTFDQYKDLFGLTSKHLKNKKTLEPRGVNELQAIFEIDPATVASDASTEFLRDRPLLREKKESGSEIAISLLSGIDVYTNTQPDAFPGLIDAAFQRFHAEMKAATLKKDQLRAIAKLIRFLHVFHMFTDGNGRLHCYLLLPRLLLEHGFGPPLKLGNYFFKETLYGLFNGCFTLDQIVTFLWYAQQKDSDFENVLDKSYG